MEAGVCGAVRIVSETQRRSVTEGKIFVSFSGFPFWNEQWVLAGIRLILEATIL
jgi:hypothetical protein